MTLGIIGQTQTDHRVWREERSGFFIYFERRIY
jgi:hypothetical protein